MSTLIKFFVNSDLLAYWTSVTFYEHLFECHSQQQILIVGNVEFLGLWFLHLHLIFWMQNKYCNECKEVTK